MPPIVRTCSELLNSSSARSTFTCALVGTARTWRASRRRGGGGGGAPAAPRGSRAPPPRGPPAVRAVNIVLDVLVGRQLERLACIASPSHAPEQRASLLWPARRRGHLTVRRLADPALVVGAVGAQLAHEVALAAGGQIRLRALAFEDRATADVARHVLVGGAKFLLHGGGFGLTESRRGGGG